MRNNLKIGDIVYHYLDKEDKYIVIFIDGKYAELQNIKTKEYCAWHISELGNWIQLREIEELFYLVEME